MRSDPSLYRAALCTVLLCAALATTACATTPEPRPMPTPQEARDAINTVLDDFHDAASKADGPRYFDHFTPDGVFIGTDATERWDVTAFRAYAEPHFGAGRGWTYVPTTRHIALSPDRGTAWFDESLQNEHFGDVRGSGVLVYDGQRWRVAQYVLSFPVPNEVAAEVIDIIKRGPLPKPDPAPRDEP